MSDILREPRISLTDLAKREGVNVCTVWRWVTRGVAGVKLESFAIGHRRFTSSPNGAFERWVAEVTAAKCGESIASRLSRRGESHRREVRKELLDSGLLDE
ncbi:MAG: DUF1580 domain-containing protein [Pirellulales bacterium]